MCVHRPLHTVALVVQKIILRPLALPGRSIGPCKNYGFIGFLTRAPGGPGAPGRPSRALRGPYRGLRGPPGGSRDLRQTKNQPGKPIRISVRANLLFNPKNQNLKSSHKSFPGGCANLRHTKATRTKKTLHHETPTEGILRHCYCAALSPNHSNACDADVFILFCVCFVLLLCHCAPL